MRMEKPLAASWSLTARWVFPVDGPPLERGVVVVDGDKIAAVEPYGAHTADLDLGDAAVLPGLVNCAYTFGSDRARGLFRRQANSPIGFAK